MVPPSNMAGLPAASLTSAESACLEAREWGRYVGRGRGLLVSVAAQRLAAIAAGQVLRRYPCSTGKAGIGSMTGSGCTPPGWHEVGEKIGAGLPAGAALKGRRWTGAVLAAGQDDGADHILSRILRLAGLEPGLNLGGEVDTWARLIYIHGTAAEAMLGRPASHGCVRLSSRDVIELFDLVEVGCRVLIAPD